MSNFASVATRWYLTFVSTPIKRDDKNKWSCEDVREIMYSKMFCELCDMLYKEKYYCLWHKFIICQDMGMYVCLCCKFKSALYKLVGTLYKLIFPPFWSVCYVCLQLKKIFEIKIHTKLIHSSQNWLWWLKEATWVYYNVLWYHH